jgi:hypothetical protein
MVSGENGGKKFFSLRFLFRAYPAELKLLISAVCMLTLAYALTFTTRAYAITGRDTRVHSAAIVGSSIIFAVIAYLLFRVQKPFLRQGIFIGLVLLISLNTAFGVLLQKEYASAWILQRDFWTELLPLIEDVEEGTVVLIEPSGLEDTHQIWANHWNLPRILVQLYLFPESWRPLPKVYRLVPEWREYILTEDGAFQLNVSTVVAPPSTYQDVRSDQVILIHTEQGHLVRQAPLITLNGIEFVLKPQTPPNLPELETGFLFNLLIDSQRSGLSVEQ